MKSINYAIIRSVCALIIGVLLVIWPEEAVKYLVITIGVLFLIPGLYGVFSFFSRSKNTEADDKRKPFPIPALGSALLGFLLMVIPSFFVSVLMYVLGALLVLAGLSQLLSFASARSYAYVPMLVFVIPSLILISGVVVLFNPFQAASIPFMVLGIAAIVYSLTDLTRLMVYRRQVKDELTEMDEMREEAQTATAKKATAAYAEKAAANDDVEDVVPIEEIKD